MGTGTGTVVTTPRARSTGTLTPLCIRPVSRGADAASDCRYSQRPGPSWEGLLASPPNPKPCLEECISYCLVLESILPLFGALLVYLFL